MFTVTLSDKVGCHNYLIMGVVMPLGYSGRGDREFGRGSLFSCNAFYVNLQTNKFSWSLKIVLLPI